MKLIRSAIDLGVAIILWAFISAGAYALYSEFLDYQELRSMRPRLEKVQHGDTQKLIKLNYQT